MPSDLRKDVYMTKSYPKITIVTPSYNQGQFLDDTIQSVLGQGYPNLEYFVMDGGSTDNSVEIIKKHEKHLAHWVSAKDDGQAAAINAGFARATGDILGWLNSDDMYLPGALSFVATHLNTAKPELVFGNCMHLRENSAFHYGSDVVGRHAKTPLQIQDYMVQPSTFWTRNAWETIGPLDDTLHYSFDWEWFLRAEQAGVAFTAVDKYLSVYRLHDAHKTGTGGDKRQTELAEVYGRFAGPATQALYVECCKSGDAVDAFMARLKRLRLLRLAGPLLRWQFPQLFGKASAQDVWYVMEMR